MKNTPTIKKAVEIGISNDDVVAIKVNEIELQLKDQIEASEVRQRQLNEQYNLLEMELINDIDVLAKAQFDSSMVEAATIALNALGMAVEPSFSWGKDLKRNEHHEAFGFDLDDEMINPFGPYGPYMPPPMIISSPQFNKVGGAMYENNSRRTAQIRSRKREAIEEYEKWFDQETKKIPKQIEAALFFKPKDDYRGRLDMNSGHLRDAYMPLPPSSRVLEVFGLLAKKSFSLPEAIQEKMKKHTQTKIDYDKEHENGRALQRQLGQMDVIERQARAALAKLALRQTETGQKILDHLENVKPAEVIE